MYSDVGFAYTHIEYVFFAISKNCGIVKELIVVSEMLLALEVLYKFLHLLDYLIQNVDGRVKWGTKYSVKL